MSSSSGYGTNGSNNSNSSNGSNTSNSSNGSNAAAENHAEMGSSFSSSLNGASLAGTVSSSMASATCTSGGRSVANSNDAAQTMAVAMQVDAELDSGMGSSLTRTPMNSSMSSLSGDAAVATSSRDGVAENSSVSSAPMSPANRTLYNSVLADIRSGLLSAQLPANSATPGNLEAELRVRANLLLQQNLTSRGLAPSERTLAELRNTVDTYCRLIGWLQPGETLENATIEIDYRMQNGSVERIRCRAADNVKNLQEAISARFGVAGCTRQLLCNGEPLTDPTQCLYRFVARRGEGMRRAGALTVQEVVRVSSG